MEILFDEEFDSEILVINSLQILACFCDTVWNTMSCVNND